MRTLGALVTALGLIATSCGGGSDSAETPADAEAPPAALPEGELRPLTVDDVDATSLAVADSLVDAHGDEGGFVALVLAMERGYDVGQIIDAALNDEVDANGRISEDGTIVEPSAGRLGVISLPESEEALGLPDGGYVAVFHGRAARGPSEPFEPSGLLAQLRQGPGRSGSAATEAGRDLIAVVVSLGLVGYSLGQIIEALLVGNASLFGDGSCPVLVDRDVGFVRPASEAVGNARCNTVINETEDEIADRAAEIDTIPETDASGELDDIDGAYDGTVSLFGDSPLTSEFSVGTNAVNMVVEGGAITSFSVDVLAEFDFAGCTDSFRLLLDADPATSAPSGDGVALAGDGTLIFSSPCEGGGGYDNCGNLPWTATFRFIGGNAEGSLDADDCGESVPFAVELERADPPS